jgi:hypothetical protein
MPAVIARLVMPPSGTSIWQFEHASRGVLEYEVIGGVNLVWGYFFDGSSCKKGGKNKCDSVSESTPEVASAHAKCGYTSLCIISN